MVEWADGRDVAPHPRVEPNVRMAGRLSAVERFEGRIAGLPSFLVLDAADVLDAVGEAVDARVERGRRVRCQEPLDFRQKNVAAHLPPPFERGSSCSATAAASPNFST